MRHAVALCCVTLGAATVAGAERPNILFILADDLGKEWLSCYGSEHKTPQLDALAAGGVRFENCYATPLCTPTRHEMLTGRYPFRTGWTVHHDTPRWGGQYFDWNREVTFARVLRDAGYATAIAGKWQMNDFRTHPDALRRHGFNEHCVWPGVEADNPPAAERYFDPFVQTNGKRETLKGRFGPDVFCDFIVDFMERHRTVPFCAYYAMVLPHPPMTKTPRNLDTDKKGAALYPGMVDYIDYQVGLLIKVLEDLKIRDKTIVFFAADNGSPGTVCRANGRDVHGGKSDVVEPGICVPFLVNGPGQVLAGKVSDELIDFSDVFPTLLDLAGARPPKDVVIDGRSFVWAFTGRPRTGPARDWIYSQLGPKRVIRDKRFKMYWDGRLYDLIADPAERLDLGESDNRDVLAAHQKLEKALKSLPADAKLPFGPQKTEEPVRKPPRERSFEQPDPKARDTSDLK